MYLTPFRSPSETPATLPRTGTPNARNTYIQGSHVGSRGVSLKLILGESRVRPEWHFHKTYVVLRRRALATVRGSFR